MGHRLWYTSIHIDANLRQERHPALRCNALTAQRYMRSTARGALRLHWTFFRHFRQIA